MPEGVFLVAMIKNQSTVMRRCDKAKRLGIKEGSALTLAQAFLPNATVSEFDPLGDFKALYKICVWTQRYTPLHSLDSDLIAAYKQRDFSQINPESFGINLDITGTERVNHGEHVLINSIGEKMLRARLDARVAIAPTLGLAWALSRYGVERIVVYSEASHAVLHKLSVAALRLPQPTIQALHDVGVKNIESLLAIPRRALGKRYGSKILQRIDQLLGDEPEYVNAIPVPNVWKVSREFEYPLNRHDQIVETCMELLDQLSRELSEKGRVARRFVLYFQGEDVWGVPFRFHKEFSIVFSSSNSSHIQSTLYPLVEKLSLPGAVYLILLNTVETEKRAAAQIDIEGKQQASEDIQHLTNKLVVQVGQENVCTVQFAGSFVPERSFTYLPASQADTQSTIPILNESKIRERPSQLLETPEEIAAVAMLPDRPPSRIIWKGKDLKVLKGVGPERISIGWREGDEGDSPARDYFKIEDELGRWLWIFRNTETMQWFLHGLWV